jgi:hypothetical protein
LPKGGSTPLTSLHGPFGDAHIKLLLGKLISSEIGNCNAKIGARIRSAARVPPQKILKALLSAAWN